MKIIFQDIPSLPKLIATMDAHPLGAALFVFALLISSAAVVACFWLYFGR